MLLQINIFQSVNFGHKVQGRTTLHATSINFDRVVSIFSVIIQRSCGFLTTLELCLFLLILCPSLQCFAHTLIITNFKPECLITPKCIFESSSKVFTLGSIFLNKRSLLGLRWHAPLETAGKVQIKEKYGVQQKCLSYPKGKVYKFSRLYSRSG